MHCHHCNEEIKIMVSNFPGRHDDCPSCGYDLRCCLNCTFYDRSSANECKEIISERVSDKEKANYCDYFEPSDREGSTMAKKPDFNDLSKQLAASLKNLK